MFLYSLISTIGLFFYLPVLIFKKGPESKRTFLSERLGICSYRKTDVWVHAVSVGEVLASLPFLKKLKETFPDKRVVLSTTTYTGQKIANDRFAEADRIMYMPIDSILCVRRAVRILRPSMFVAIETELWPTLLQTLKKNSSHTAILNGRLSKKSYKGYKRIKGFMQKVFDNIDFLYMQGKGDAKRIVALGADKKKVDVMGNFKFDINFDQSDPPEWTRGIDRPVLLAASTHSGEEEVILDAYKKIKKRVSSPEFRASSSKEKKQSLMPDNPHSEHQTGNITMIIAPRHPERFGEVEDLISKKRLSYLKRSELNRPENGNLKVDVILLNTMGELAQLFSKSDIAFIGGSLVPHGGHNVMEPAYWSKPSIFGPHMDNFPIAKVFLERNAALEVKDARELEESIIQLLSVPEKAAKIGQNAKSIVDENTGAVDKAVKLIRGYIGNS